MRYALVTGSTKGIGLAIASRLIDKGYFVYINYAGDDEAAAFLNLDGAKHKIVKADLAEISGMDLLIKEILKKDDIIFDCFVFNAGLTCREPFGQVGYDDWTRVMNANVNIPFFIVQKLRERLADNASIIFIGSDMGIYPHSVSIAYSVSKAACHMLAKSLVKEFAHRNIRVNAIAPGFIDTEWQKEKPDWLREKIENKIALKRFGTPAEVSDACMFLLENTYVNGAILQIDGGYNFE